jgi:hypothetical protein
VTGSPRDFYDRRVPAQWNRALDLQRRAAGDDSDAARIADAMEAVNGSIRVVVAGAEGREETFHLNIADGRMLAADEPCQAPFMTLAHDRGAFEILERESGDSVLGFLGGLAGLGEEMKLTAGRMQNLAGLNGTLRFCRTGERGFTILVHFGAVAIGGPTCSLEIDPEAYEQLRAGTLSPHEAFMNEQIVATGDMQMAMQLALAAMTPD